MSLLISSFIVGAQAALMFYLYVFFVTEMRYTQGFFYLNQEVHNMNNNNILNVS